MIESTHLGFGPLPADEATWKPTADRLWPNLDTREATPDAPDPMKILVVSDLHSSLKRFDWVVQPSGHHDLVFGTATRLTICRGRAD